MIKNFGINPDGWMYLINQMADVWQQAIEKWHEEQEKSGQKAGMLIQKWMKDYSSWMEPLWQPFIKQQKNNSSEAGTALQPALNIFKQLQGYELQSFPFLILGSQRDAIPQTELPAEYSDFFSKLVQIQQLFNKAAFTGWQNMMALIRDHGHRSPFRSLANFYRTWSAINKKEFDNLFRSAEYVKLQEELQKIRSRIMSSAEKSAGIKQVPAFV